MQCRCVGLILLVLTYAASAQEDLLACLDPDVRAGLLFETTGSSAILSRTVPEMLTVMPPFEDLEFIGSAVSAFLTVAAYRTDLAPGDAVDAVSARLREANWREAEFGGVSRGGFVTIAQPQRSTFCRDDATLNAVGRAINETTYVRLQISDYSGFGLGCDARLGDRADLIAHAELVTRFHERMPTLELPEDSTPLDPRVALAEYLAGFSGDDRTMKIEIEFESELSVPGLVEHFERQLQLQGWTYDAGWSGRNSSGSSWMLSPVGETELVGLLDVIALNHSGYRATFRASSTEAG